LRPAQERLTITGWLFPVVSSRWNDLFGYGQFRTEFRTGGRIRPYFTIRFDGDTRSKTEASPLFSETSVIFAGGVRTLPWHGVSAWIEAGMSANYLERHMVTDYRGGISVVRFVGRPLNGEAPGWFEETNADGVFMSRFGNDLLLFGQLRAGYCFGVRVLRIQVAWTGGLTVDTTRQAWANFVETGPSLRLRSGFMPTSMYLTFQASRGDYPIRDGDPRHRGYTDYRAGIWYAFSY
jgi:hypothetical protein